jgi:dienelactone hydrolase
MHGSHDYILEYMEDTNWKTPGRRIEVTHLSIHVQAQAGTFDADLYLPAGGCKAPLVIVAHGFWRSKEKMADWGRHLAEQDFAVAVPTLPAWADHARNGQAIRELIDWISANVPAANIDTEHVGLVGFSAGGLATLLAANDPRVRVWVGLDPVDVTGKGAAAAKRVSAFALVLRAEPHSCNGYGNAQAIQDALTARSLCLMVAGATHADPEWPTDLLAEAVCGKSSEARRALFVRYATATLRSELLSDLKARAVLDAAEHDAGVRCCRNYEDLG